MGRNIKLDYLKILLSIMVVCIHIQPLFGISSLAGEFISNGFSRIAVPLFFIISGYYVSPQLGSYKKILNYLKHIFLIYVVWMLIYLPFSFELFNSPLHVMYMLVIGYAQLWYLPATMIGMILLFVAHKYLKIKHILWTAMFLFFIATVFSGYGMAPGGKIFYAFRSGLFMGFPFLALGHYIRTNGSVQKLKDNYLIMGIVAGLLLIIVETLVKYRLQDSYPIHKDFIFSALLICPLLFIYVQKHPLMSLHGKGFLGTLSGGIYFTHMLFITIINMPDEYHIKYVLPVVLLSCAATYILYLINKRVKLFF